MSGGHTAIFLVENYNEYKIVGLTRDDAAGEAFDKIAKLCGLDYPGGPLIDKYAKEGDKKNMIFRVLCYIQTILISVSVD